MTISFITTTSYGTWLPGEARGYVRNGGILPGDTGLLAQSISLLKGKPVYFSALERDQLFDSLVAACQEFRYCLSDVTVEAWHLHWILFHNEERIETVVGRLKTRMRQGLSRGRICTEGYCAEPLFENEAIDMAQAYIARHDGCRMIDCRIVERNTPGKAGG